MKTVRMASSALVMSVGLVLCFAPNAARAQEPLKVIVVEEENPDFGSRISVGPLGLLLGIGNFSYEGELTKHLAFEVSPWGIYWNFDDTKLYGGSLGLGIATYLTGNAPEGLRLAFSVAPGFIGADGKDDQGLSVSESVFMFGAKATIGYNWIWKNGFTIGLNAGVQYLYFDLTEIADQNTSLSGLLPALDFNLGFAF